MSYLRWSYFNPTDAHIKREQDTDRQRLASDQKKPLELSTHPHYRSCPCLIIYPLPSPHTDSKGEGACSLRPHIAPTVQDLQGFFHKYLQDTGKSDINLQLTLNKISKRGGREEGKGESPAE